MACERHQELSSFVKGVHQNLRLQSRAIGVDEAWFHHCQQTDVLKKYAENMQLLATEFWEKNNGEKSELCRIQWVVRECIDYFNNEGVERAIHKERKMSEIYLKNFIEQTCISVQSISLLKLLDVGSCYNPFSSFSLFDVTAIDLMPAAESVYTCDFLTVNISSAIHSVQEPCTELPENYFDIVVFSLLLEYFPSSKQRFLCCKRACSVLKENGLLFILTPDSKHATANSGLMKSWRFALASLGFWRHSYQKLKHLHCMSYRKCVDSRVAKHWLSLQQCKECPEDLMYIPQDFNDYTIHDVEDSAEERCDEENKLLAETFSILPNCNTFS